MARKTEVKKTEKFEAKEVKEVKAPEKNAEERLKEL